jgi:hypothetical protein
MRPVTVFIAGGVAGALVRPYLVRATRNLLVSVIESVEKTQLELEHVEKLKAEAEAAKAEALRLQDEARRLRDEAQAAAAAPVSTPEPAS